jgi:hypothetical protein
MSDTEATAILDEALPVSHVRDLSQDFQLVSDSQHIRATLEHIGRLDELGNTGCLFVQLGEGEYLAVYQCERSIPALDARVWRLL